MTHVEGSDNRFVSVARHHAVSLDATTRLCNHGRIQYLRSGLRSGVALGKPAANRNLLPRGPKI